MVALAKDRSVQQGKIKLLAVSRNLSEGGAQRFLSTLLTHLDDELFSKSLIVIGDKITYPIPSSTTVMIIPFAGIRDALCAPWRLAKIIARQTPDIILSNATPANLMVGLVRSVLRMRQGRWVVRFANDPALHEYWVRRWASRFLLRGAHRFVANSSGLAASVQRCLPFTRGHTDVLHNPVDLEKLAIRSAESPARALTEPYVAMVARLVPQKRVDLAIDVIAMLRPEFTVQLVVLGAGPLAEPLRQHAEALQVGAQVQFLGWQENPFAIVQRAALLLSVSDHEGLPNALIEAQALGVAAVATDCPHGVSDVVSDGVTGFLVPTGDRLGLAEKIRYLLRNPTERKKMGANAKAKIQNEFAVHKVVPVWQNFLTAVHKGNTDAYGRR